MLFSEDGFVGLSVPLCYPWVELGQELFQAPGKKRGDRAMSNLISRRMMERVLATEDKSSCPVPR